MSKVQGTGTRKRLALDDPDEKPESSGKSLSRKFKPNFQRPVTRLLNGIKKPKKSVSITNNAKMESNHDKKKVVSDKNNSNRMNKGVDSRIVKLTDDSEQSDKSNNNATAIMMNPDPSKYVLTKWGDVSTLGKRKMTAGQELSNEEVCRVDDGIQVMVTDTNELDFDDDFCHTATG